MSIAWNELDPTHSSRPSWKTPAEGYGASTLVHLVILGVLSIFTFVESPFSGDQGLLMNWNSKASVDPLEPDPVHPQEFQPRPGGAQTAAVALLMSSDDVQITTTEMKESSLLAVTHDDGSSAHMAEYVGTFSTFGNGDGDGFFGKPGTAKSFVFVLDRSLSMNKPHIYSGDLSRFQRLKLELIRFIDRLKPEQKFYVIFFDEQPHPMPSNGLIEATKENKEDFLQWLTAVTAGGRTDPRAAVQMAMYLNPDRIYFLSDGEILELFRAEMLQLPVGEWKLDTYAFGEGSERFMRVFAKKHGGEYVYIP